MIACFHIVVFLFTLLQCLYPTKSWGWRRSMHPSKRWMLHSNRATADDFASSVQTSITAATVEDSLPITKQVYYNPTYPMRARVNISLETPFGEPILSKTSAKNELLSLLSSTDRVTADQNNCYTAGGSPALDCRDALDLHLRIEYLCQALHDKYIPIQTIPFLDFVHRGQWKKLYSNVVLPPIATHPVMTANQASLSLNLTQEIMGDAVGTGTVVEHAHFRYSYVQSNDNDAISTTNDEVVFSGDLQIWSTYSYNSKGQMETVLKEHIIVPTSDFVPIDDMETFISLLQRALPFETFDPNLLVGELLVSILVC